MFVHRRIKLPAGVAVPILPVEDAELTVARVLGLFAPPVRDRRSASTRPPASRRPRRSARAPRSGPTPSSASGRSSAAADLHAGAYLGDDVTVGDNCEFFPNVVVRERITIGHRVTIHANSVLGTDGFGYRWDGTQHAKIPQIGTVIVEDDVEIGSCVCIDRARLTRPGSAAGPRSTTWCRSGTTCRRVRIASSAARWPGGKRYGRHGRSSWWSSRHKRPRSLGRGVDPRRLLGGHGRRRAQDHRQRRPRPPPPSNPPRTGCDPAPAGPGRPGA